MYYISRKGGSVYATKSRRPTVRPRSSHISSSSIMRPLRMRNSHGNTSAANHPYPPLPSLPRTRFPRCIEDCHALSFRQEHMTVALVLRSHSFSPSPSPTRNPQVAITVKRRAITPQRRNDTGCNDSDEGDDDKYLCGPGTMLSSPIPSGSILVTQSNPAV